MAGGVLDRARVTSFAHEIIDAGAAASTSGAVRVYGDCAAILAGQGPSSRPRWSRSGSGARCSPSTRSPSTALIPSSIPGTLAGRRLPRALRRARPRHSRAHLARGLLRPRPLHRGPPATSPRPRSGGRRPPPQRSAAREPGPAERGAGELARLRGDAGQRPRAGDTEPGRSGLPRGDRGEGRARRLALVPGDAEQEARLQASSGEDIAAQLPSKARVDDHRALEYEGRVVGRLTPLAAAPRGRTTAATWSSCARWRIAWRPSWRTLASTGSAARRCAASPRPIAARTSSWPCSATSCATPGADHHRGGPDGSARRRAGAATSAR